MIAIIGWVAALVAALTGLAMAQDAPVRPADRSYKGWVRHVVRTVLLIGITAFSAVLLIVPAAQCSSLYDVGLRCCLAGFMASQAPCPWWRYVAKGPSGVVDRRRSA